MRDLALKRHNDVRKALRKRNICREAYKWEYYNNLHQYSKNKIHCSCPSCSAKTNRKFYGNGSHGKKNWKPSDIRKIDSLNSSLKEYLFDEAV